MGLEGELESGSVDYDSLRNRIKSDFEILKQVAAHPNQAMDFLNKNLDGILSSEKAIDAYQKFGMGELLGKLMSMGFSEKACCKDSDSRNIFDNHGLLNAESFKKLISSEKAKVLSQDGTTFAVMYFDMNGLKATNDDFCHSAGDQAIDGISNALRYSKENIFDESAESIRRVMDERINIADRRNPDRIQSESSRERRTDLGYRVRKSLTEADKDHSIVRLATDVSNLYGISDGIFNRDNMKIERIGGDEFIVVLSCPKGSAKYLCESYYSQVRENVMQNEVLTKYGITVSAGYSIGINLKETIFNAERAAKFSKIISGHAENNITEFGEEVEKYIAMTKSLEKAIKRFSASFSDNANYRITSADVYELSRYNQKFNINSIKILDSIGVLDTFVREINLCRDSAVDDLEEKVKITAHNTADIGSIRLNLGERTIRRIYEYCSGINPLKRDEISTSIEELTSRYA